MELQRILARDTREGIAKIHALYGDDALVISNKKARKQTEFIVAIDIAADAHTMTASLSSTKSRVSTPANSNEPTFDQIIETEIFKSRPPLELQSKICAPDKIIMPALNRTNDDLSLIHI